MSSYSKQQVVRTFLDDLKHTEQELISTLEVANRRYSNTSRVIVAVMITIFIAIMLSLFLIFQFSRDVEQIVVSMDALDQQIVETRQNTDEIQYHLSEVAQDTKPMLSLVKSTSAISDNIALMNQYFTGIEHNSISMSQSSDVIDQELREMNQRFKNVNQNMTGIVYNVNQLSKNVP